MENLSTVNAGIQPQVYRFEFRGKAGEYFRIWIVNLALSIITLGIYSAWAKVRTRRYFYGSTFVDNTSFDYHADPIRILKGRIIFAIFMACYFGGRFFPPLYIFAAFGALLFPFFMVRGMIFNLTNTSYRGVRFGFEKDYKGAYRTYIKGALVAVFTLYIFLGFTLFWHQQFRVTRSRFGRTPFKFNGEKWAFWKIVIRHAGLLVLGGLLLVGGIAGFGVVAAGANKIVSVAAMFILVLAFYSWVGFVATAMQCKMANYVFQHSALGPVRVKSRYEGLDLFLIYIQNFFACLLTLGLAYPWAKVEIAKYRASTTALLAKPDELASFTQGANAQVGAVGEEILDFWDIDIGF